MVLDYGDQSFVVDFDTEFIQRYYCYQDGNCCLFCPDADTCLEELQFVYEELNERRID